MADALGLGIDVSGVVGGLTSTFYWIIMILIGLGVVCAVILGWLYMRSFKHEVIIRKITNNRKNIIVDRARTYVKKEVQYWQLYGRRLLGKKKLVTAPPSDAIELKDNGTLYAECYWKEDNPEPTWIIDKFVGDIVGLEPFTTQERSLFVNRLEDAVMRRKKNWLDMLYQIAPVLVLALIFVLILVYWEEIAKPISDLQQSNAQISTQNARISEENTKMIIVLAESLGRQDLIADLNISQTIPAGG
jgi:hypothetical protein